MLLLLDLVGFGLLVALLLWGINAVAPSSWVRADRRRRIAILSFVLLAGGAWVFAADALLSKSHAGAATPGDALFIGIFFIVGGLTMAALAVAAAINHPASSADGRDSISGSTSTLNRAVGAICSLFIGGLGFGAAALAITHTYPFTFGMLVCLLFLALAIWNVATPSRTSGYPEGQWQVGLGLLALLAGVVGLATSELRLGGLLTFIGVADLLASARARGRAR